MSAFKFPNVKTGNEHLAKLQIELHALDSAYEPRQASILNVKQLNSEIERTEKMIVAKRGTRESSGQNDHLTPRAAVSPPAPTRVPAPSVSTTPTPASHEQTRQVIQTYGGCIRDALAGERRALDRLAGRGTADRISGHEGESDFEKLRILIASVEQTRAQKAATADAREKNFEAPRGGLSLPALSFLNEQIFADSRQIESDYPDPGERYVRLLKNFACAGYDLPGTRGLSPGGVTVAWQDAKTKAMGQAAVADFIEASEHGVSASRRDSIGCRWFAKFAARQK